MTRERKRERERENNNQGEASQDTVAQTLFLSWLTCQRRGVYLFFVYLLQVRRPSHKKSPRRFSTAQVASVFVSVPPSQSGKGKSLLSDFQGKLSCSNRQEFTIPWLKKRAKQNKSLGEKVCWQNRRFHFLGPKAAISA